MLKITAAYLFYGPRVSEVSKGNLELLFPEIDPDNPEASIDAVARAFRALNGCVTPKLEVKRIDKPVIEGMPGYIVYIGDGHNASYELPRS